MHIMNFYVAEIWLNKIIMITFCSPVRAPGAVSNSPNPFPGQMIIRGD